MKRKRKWVMYVIFVFLIVWPVYQIIGMVSAHSEKQDAGKLLYQVSLFQMELLSSYLHDIEKVKDTEALNPLRQAVYTANFTHQHLVLAYGEDVLTPLEGLSQLMQFVLRLQIGGQRPLKGDEIQALMEVRKQFDDLYDAYGKLLSSKSDIVASQNQRLQKDDKSMTDLLRKKLIQ
ncbi:S-adenosylmethionine decarboxylase [Paenibacillus sp. RC67]|uniref:S-adenosylmethionine decarboxylase n=1 Tax=Paenibacillus sp. RC67 TaxID=3039392 RepID=UPI0024AD2431|nr:S-adenosylmethionine decarboxylase [Paenibacillus sp. RC67]